MVRPLHSRHYGGHDRASCLATTFMPSAEPDTRCMRPPRIEPCACLLQDQEPVVGREKEIQRYLQRMERVLTQAERMHSSTHVQPARRRHSLSNSQVPSCPASLCSCCAAQQAHMSGSSLSHQACSIIIIKYQSAHVQQLCLETHHASGGTAWNTEAAVQLDSLGAKRLCLQTIQFAVILARPHEGLMHDHSSGRCDQCRSPNNLCCI